MCAPRYLYEIHCTCFCPVISLSKAQLTWASSCCSIPHQRDDDVVMTGALHLDHLEVPDQNVLINILARLHFSKESSTACEYLPPLLSETSDHLSYNDIASWTLAQSVLYRRNSQRRLGGFEAVQIWSYKNTFEKYLKYQILNLFEMSNILNLFKMSSSTSV